MAGNVNFYDTKHPYLDKSIEYNELIAVLRRLKQGKFQFQATYRTHFLSIYRLLVCS
jgi:hypothetical protein